MLRSKRDLRASFSLAGSASSSAVDTLRRSMLSESRFRSARFLVDALQKSKLTINATAIPTKRAIDPNHQISSFNSGAVIVIKSVSVV